MDINYMRAKVASAYPGDRWLLKVADMPPKQVYAVYMSFLERKLIK